jgi:outer membrane protein TolC
MTQQDSPFHRACHRLTLWVCAVGAAVGPVLRAELPAEAAASDDLTMKIFLQRVLDYNESIQVKLLEMEVARRKLLAERGIFEPELVGSAEHVDTQRENTLEQRRSQGIDVFKERNNIYNAGLESLIPSGARVRLGYTLRDLDNNLASSFLGPESFTNQYSAFFGASLTQPLLKNFGAGASLANIRLAAVTSEIAFNDYRKQMMLVIAAAEAAYWNLHMAQQQLLFFQESVALAETILKDNRTRLQAGKGSELEVLEAESGLALRRSKQSEAFQKYYEAANRLASFYSGSVVRTNRFVLVVDQPEATDLAPTFFESWSVAYDQNPDYQIQRKRLIAEGIRVAYAKNQRLPQLDLRASYGLNGLGATPAESWDDVERADFPSWSVGMELRVPLGGGIRVRHELDAAKLREKQALLGLQELETQIANGLDTALRKVRSARDNVQSYQALVNFNENLLKSQLARLEVGKVESRKVLEVEADLLEARNAVVDAKVQFERALIELELIQGSVLKSRHLEVNQKDLETATALVVRNGRLTDDQYEKFLKAVRWEYEKKAPPADAARQAVARQLLDQRMTDLEAPHAVREPISREDEDKALRLLRQKMDQPKP